MFFLSSFWGNVGEAIVDAIRTLMMSLCDIIYKFIIFFYDIFIKLGNATILSESTIEEMYERIGLILGLFMIFRVTFALIQYVINPDIMYDKQKGIFNIVKRIFIVIILLGVTRPIFNFAYETQGLIINSNIIPKIITGKNISSSESGKTLAWYAFSSFYTFDARVGDNPDLLTRCPELNVGRIADDFIENKSLGYAFNCVNEKVEYKTIDGKDAKYYLIDFPGNGLVAAVVGGLILWMIVMYTIQVGIRVIQLGYLQLIAPIPIISYLTPKGEETLNKWIKQCTSTYLDFFIRVAIIYFVIFLVDLLISNDYNGAFIGSLGDVTGLEMTWINIVMILALLIFAKKVPDLLKEVFPISKSAASFDFGLSAKKNITEPLKWAYKDTPLGWAPRALGWTAKKGIGAIDRKIHNLPKPRNKVQQYIDKLAPGYAENVKNKHQAMADERARRIYINEGEALYMQYSIPKPDGSGELTLDYKRAFTHDNFKQSYDKVKSAKKSVGIAEAALESERANLDAAYMSDDKKKIAIAEARVKAARDNLKTNQTMLENAQKEHNSNRAIYKNDAAIEDKYKYYADNYASKTVDIDAEGRKEAEKYDNENSVSPVPNSYEKEDNNLTQELSTEDNENMINKKKTEIEEQKKIIEAIHNRSNKALDSSDADQVVQAQNDLIEAEAKLKSQQAELELLQKTTSSQSKSNNASVNDDDDNLVQPIANNPKYTQKDLNEAKAKLATLIEKYNKTKSTEDEMEVQKQGWKVKEIDDYLKQNK